MTQRLLYLFVVFAFVFASTVNAQNLIETATTKYNGFTPTLKSDTEMLFEQAIHIDDEGGISGIVSGTFEQSFQRVLSADDFQLPFPAEITRLSFEGFQGQAASEAFETIFIAMEVYVYADVSNNPDDVEEGSEVAFARIEFGDPGLEVVREDGTIIFTVVMDLEEAGLTFELDTQRYWMVAAPVMNIPGDQQGNRMNWGRAEQTFGEPQLNSLDGLFGLEPGWIPFSGLDIIWEPAGLSMFIEGRPAAAEAPGPFSLMSPENGAQITVGPDDESLIQASWEASANATNYSWRAIAPGGDFAEPSLALPADNDGAGTTITLPAFAVFAQLVDLGNEPGDIVELEWTVWATSGESEPVQADETWTLSIVMEGGDVSVDPETGLPTRFALNNNYPNPFNPTTNISFDLPQTSEVTIEVFNIQGQRVATLVNGTMNAGSQTVAFDASGLSSGIYLYRMTAGSFTQTNKMMLVK